MNRIPQRPGQVVRGPRGFPRLSFRIPTPRQSAEQIRQQAQQNIEQARKQVADTFYKVGFQR